jgi:hypothetical protein
MADLWTESLSTDEYTGFLSAVVGHAQSAPAGQTAPVVGARSKTLAEEPAFSSGEVGGKGRTLLEAVPEAVLPCVLQVVASRKELQTPEGRLLLEPLEQAMKEQSGTEDKEQGE